MLVQSYEKPQVGAAAEENEGTLSAQREGEQAKEEEEQSLEVHVTETEAQGQADEGERIPRIVEQMHNEDDKTEQMRNVGTHQTRMVTKCQLSGGSRVLATLWYKMAGVRSGSTERTR